MEPHLQISDMAAELPYNSQRSSLLCPYCHGGSSKEYSLSMRREYNLAFFQCHRASCNKNGVVKAVSGAVTVEEMRDPAPPSCYDKPLIDIPTKARNYLASEWFVTEEHIEKGQWKWAKQDNRLYMPILGRARNKEIGWILRALTPAKDKTLTFLCDIYLPVMSFHASDNADGRVIIVEDIPSAVRASKFVHAVALLGTHLSESKIGEIKRWGMDTALLALDKDVVKKAAKAMPELSSRMHTTKLLSHKMHKDIKNMTDEEIKTLLTTE